MAARRASHTTTEEYPVPSGGALSDARPALLCAFPSGRRAPAPAPARGRVGRAWLSEAGIHDGMASGEHLAFLAGGEVAFTSRIWSRATARGSTASESRRGTPSPWKTATSCGSAAR